MSFSDPRPGAMGKVSAYLEAATRPNTRRSYDTALRHFEVQWGGFLPATPDSVARYLADHAETLSHNTLEQRLAALARWHTDQGFVDPTKAPLVRQVLRGIRATHPALEKRARPLQLELLQAIDLWLEREIAAAGRRRPGAAALRLKRDRALLLLGFWRGFRGDELLAMLVENVNLRPGVGMAWSLSRTKTNRHQGTSFSMPSLSRLCPVTAYEAWITAASLAAGPVFRSIDRWGHLAPDGLHPNSLIPLLRRLFQQAGVPEPEGFSAHSLRRGFANWATDNGWDLKSLMEHVGWRDVKSAMRYIDGSEQTARLRIERSLHVLPLPNLGVAMPELPAPSTDDESVS